jgi:hypothetical protein
MYSSQSTCSMPMNSVRGSAADQHNAELSGMSKLTQFVIDVITTDCYSDEISENSKY